ncbi:hypothetical protein DMUE_3166 [Dictyocoela muelleri]|nr:hypothetical protein DMUE_3166 [Dictyocoela muelleri]
MSLEDEFFTKCRISDRPSKYNIILREENNLNKKDGDSNIEAARNDKNQYDIINESNQRPIYCNKNHYNANQSEFCPKTNPKIRYLNNGSKMINMIKDIVENVDLIIKFIVFVLKLLFITILLITISRDVSLKVRDHRAALKMKNIKLIHNINLNNINLNNINPEFNNESCTDRSNITKNFLFENDVCYTKVFIKLVIEIFECVIDNLSFKSWLFIVVFSLFLYSFKNKYKKCC